MCTTCAPFVLKAKTTTTITIITVTIIIHHLHLLFSCLWGDGDETINHLRNKLAQRKYKTRHNLMGNVIHCESCKKFKFGHMNKWYMHNPKSVLENKTQKIIWDFKIQTLHLISARRPDQVTVNKKTPTPQKNSQIVDFPVPADHIVKLKESEKRRYLPGSC